MNRLIRPRDFIALCVYEGSKSDVSKSSKGVTDEAEPKSHIHCSFLFNKTFA